MGQAIFALLTSNSNSLKSSVYESKLFGDFENKFLVGNKKNVFWDSCEYEYWEFIKNKLIMSVDF